MNLSLPLPFTINKFVEGRVIDQVYFQQKWKDLKETCVMSDCKEFNQKIVKNIGDVKRFFGDLMDLYSNRNKPKPKSYAAKFGILLVVGGYHDFLMRILVKPNNHALIQIEGHPGKQRIAEFLLQTYSYLFFAK
jgi:hypothetical protein